MQDNDTNRTIEQLQRRVQNLELFALAILIGIGVYMTRQARSWFEFQNGQSLIFGSALTLCLVLLFLRHHLAGLLSNLGLNQRVANLVLGGVSVVGVAYLLPALITTLY